MEKLQITQELNRRLFLTFRNGIGVDGLWLAARSERGGGLPAGNRPAVRPPGLPHFDHGANG